MNKEAEELIKENNVPTESIVPLIKATLIKHTLEGNLRAVELLGKMHGLFTDKMEIVSSEANREIMQFLIEVENAEDEGFMDAQSKMFETLEKYKGHIDSQTEKAIMEIMRVKLNNLIDRADSVG